MAHASKLLVSWLLIPLHGETETRQTEEQGELGAALVPRALLGTFWYSERSISHCRFGTFDLTALQAKHQAPGPALVPVHFDLAKQVSDKGTAHHSLFHLQDPIGPLALPSPQQTSPSVCVAHFFSGHDGRESKGKAV